MATLRIEHGVRDYERWKAAFDSDPVGRAAGGTRRYVIWRQADDPNRVTIDLEFETTGEAEAFRGRLQSMWEGAGPALGLEDISARILDLVEESEL